MECFLKASILLLCTCLVSSFEFKHHNNQEVLKVLESVHQACPNITRIYTLSETSVMENPLYIIEFSTNPGEHEPLKPEFKYIANMHGNEVLGRELMLKLADHLCEKYRTFDKGIQALLKKTRIHLMPSMNPDGWQIATEKGGSDYLLGRSNANDVDLNRDFPDLDRIMFGNEEYQLKHNNHLMNLIRELDHPVQPETLAVMRLIMSTPFVLSANLHGGDLVANYPYDSSRTGASSEYTTTPDDDTFRAISLVYSRSHPTMGDPKRRSCEPLENIHFGKTEGIINGAKWYSVRGGMQDFNYLSSNDFEITLELGCKKYTDKKDLEQEWKNNKDALINFIWQSHIGVKGMVRDSITARPIANAIIHTQNITFIETDELGLPRDINHDITSVFAGDYFRLLTPGEYLITASYNGYKPRTRRIKVTNLKNTEAPRLDFWLEPLAQPFDADMSPRQGVMEMFEDVEPPSIGTGSYGTIADAVEEPLALPRLSSSIGNRPIIQQRRDYHEQAEAAAASSKNADPVTKDWLMYYMLHNIGNM